MSPQFIYLTGQSTSAKAIIYIYDRHAHSTAVQHGQQRRHSLKRRTITHTGGHRNDRFIRKAAHHTGQSALHAGNYNNHIGLLYLRQMCKQPVYACHAAVIGFTVCKLMGKPFTEYMTVNIPYCSVTEVEEADDGSLSVKYYGLVPEDVKPFL